MEFKVEDCIFFQLAKASQSGTKFWAGSVSEFNLTAVQAMVLNFLGREDGITASELGRRVSFDSATLTGILDRLEAAGLLHRERHPEDRRSIHIRLTEQGRDAASQIYERAIAANQAFLSDFTAEEQVALHALLRKVRENAAQPPAVDPPGDRH